MKETVKIGKVCITHVHHGVNGELRRYDGTVTLVARGEKGATFDYVYTFVGLATVDEVIRHGAGAMRNLLDRWSAAVQQVHRESGP